MKKICLLAVVLTVLLISLAACSSLLDQTAPSGDGLDTPAVTDFFDDTDPPISTVADTVAHETEEVESRPAETLAEDTHHDESVSEDAVETETATGAIVPVETDLPDTTYFETDSDETEPEETEPVETEPAETLPAESELPETLPAENETTDEDHVHVWSTWQTVQEATCSESGEAKRTCSCGELETMTVAVVGHEYSMHGGEICGGEGCKLFHSCRFCDVSLLIPLEERYFFLQLSEEQQENVRAVYKALLECEADFITLPNAMTNAGEDSAEISSFLYYCCPELFQLSTNDMTRWWRGNDELKFNLIMTKAEYEAYCMALFDFLVELNELTCDMTDWEKSRFVYDLIMNRTTYEAETSDAVNPHEGSSLGPLLMGRARCQGYSNAYQLCMWAVGLECYMITGVAGPDDIPHSWNMTNFDGSYYWSDVTWDDSEGGVTLYAYFHVSTDEFTDHIMDDFWHDWNIPACDSMDMSYFAVNDCYVEAEEDAETEFLRILDSCYGRDTTIHIKFESPEQFEAILNDATLNRLIRVWVNKHGISLSWGVSYLSDARIMYLELSY